MALFDNFTQIEQSTSTRAAEIDGRVTFGIPKWIRNQSRDLATATKHSAKHKCLRLTICLAQTQANNEKCLAQLKIRSTKDIDELVTFTFTDKYRVLSSNEFCLRCRKNEEVLEYFTLLTSPKDSDLNLYIESDPTAAVSKMHNTSLEYLNEGRFTDCKIICDNDQEFVLHRIVLGIGSMFSANILDNSGNAVEFSMNGITAKALAQLLFFLYSGHLVAEKNDYDELEVLTKFAEKYKFPGLRRSCRQAWESVTMENFFSATNRAYANLTKHAILWKICSVFYFDHKDEIEKSPRWLDFNGSTENRMTSLTLRDFLRFGDLNELPDYYNINGSGGPYDRHTSKRWTKIGTKLFLSYVAIKICSPL